MSTASGAASRGLRSAWIVSAPQDLAFFLATPLVCLLLPALVLFGPLRGVSSLDVFIAVMAFSSVGHHLPGFFRAYGDRELFRRFRLRFLLAPPLGLLAFYAAARLDLHGLALILMLWSIWHVTMQHYGFTRIYDAKAGVVDRTTARLDYWLALLTFTSIVLASPGYSNNLLSTAHATAALPLFGGDLAWLGGLRWVLWSLTITVAVVHAGRTLVRLARGEPTSVQKLLLIAGTSAFLWLVWVELGDIYLGLATWELFHDVQYFAITWAYNKRLVAKGCGDTGFMRYLFTGRGARVALYVGAIGVYGGAAYLGETRSAGGWRPVCLSLALTSTFLHYYYDGFIWKVREQRTRVGLDLSGVGAEDQAAAGAPRGSQWAHAALLVAPVGLLAGLELARGDGEDLAREARVRTAIGELAPASVSARLNEARALHDLGNLTGARAAYAAALERDAECAEALAAAALIELELDPELPAVLDAAAAALARAIELEPANARHHLNLAVLELDRGGPAATVAPYREAVRLDPSLAEASLEAVLLAGYDRLARGELSAAIERLERVERAQQEELSSSGRVAVEQDVVLALVTAYEALGRYQDAVGRLEGLLGERLHPPGGTDALDPSEVYALRKRLAFDLLAAGRAAEALPQLRNLVWQQSGDREPLLWLAETLATHADPRVRDGQAALQVAEQAVELLGNRDVGAVDIRAAALAELGRFDEAIADAERALALIREQGLSGDGDAVEARLALYRAGQAYRAP